MKIYNLDNIITSSALSLYKSTWVKLDLISCAKFIIEGTDFTFDWDEGIENWIVFFHKNKVIGYWLFVCKITFCYIRQRTIKKSAISQISSCINLTN